MWSTRWALLAMVALGVASACGGSGSNKPGGSSTGGTAGTSSVTPCQTSLDCPTNEVCDKSVRRCVECVTDADCKSGDKCVGDACRPPCKSDNECTPLGLLCNKSVGYCVACLVASDCSAGETCENGTCASGGAGGAGGTAGAGGSPTGGTAGVDGGGTGGTGGTAGVDGGGTGGTVDGGGGGGTGGTAGVDGGGAGGTGGTAGLGGSSGSGGTAGSSGSGGTGGGSCTPPISGTCDTFPQCGCASGQNCDVTSTSGATSCVAAGGLAPYSQCSGSGQCPVGFSCVGLVCKPFCNVSGDCARQYLGAECEQAHGANNTPVPGLFVCSAACDPVSPGTVCGAGANCVFAAGGTDCYPAGSGVGANACPNGQKDCAIGYVCLTDQSCRRWCRVGFSECPTGQTCVQLSPTVVYNSHTYGACQ